MTYRIPDRYKDPTQFAEYQPWFKKSMTDVLKITYANGFDIYKFYEAQYNVELFRNSFGVVEQVIFPSEEDALLFLLRWA